MARASVLNIAAYRFVGLDRLPERRRDLTDVGRRLNIRGTVLLSPEGINLFLAGSSSAIESFLERLQQDALMRGLEVKRSWSDQQPFRRYLVKIKREIIPFGVESVDPSTTPAPRVGPRQLQQWLDDGEPVVLLDVRNGYEVRLGTFAGSQAIGIDHFREFPRAAERLSPDLYHARVVTFCTGGIRCEKAAPYLQQLGFQDVWQLEGGILKYFEECGAKYYDGECFVFDHRVAVDPRLAESSTVQCFRCQTPLQVAEQASPQYVPGHSCPYCFQTEADSRRDLLGRRNASISQLCQVLPGSVPYTNVREIWVDSRHDGREALEFLYELYPLEGRSAWAERLQGGYLRRGHQRLQAGDRVRRGERLEHLFPGTVEPDVATDIQIIYEDPALVVVNKPAPLPMHPCGRFNRNTLMHLLNLVYHPIRLRLAHRLDANTTGVVILSKKATIARIVQPQFERREVEKEYLVRVAGRPADDQFTCRAGISAGAVQAGARLTDEAGLPAHTDFRVLQRWEDGTSLLEARPITGRTNQIRVHLWHLGYPICGDPTYLSNHRLGVHATGSIDAAPMCLHAHRITLRHPIDGQRVSFVLLPVWARVPQF